MFSGALPLGLLGDVSWPSGLPAQVHHTVDDPFRQEDWIDGLLADAAEAGGRVETYDYAGSGHLFTDPSLPAEYDAGAATLLWQRVLTFLDAISEPPRTITGAR